MFNFIKSSQYLPHTLSLDIFENTLFYADTTKQAIMKLRRHTILTPANVTYHYKFNAAAISNGVMPKFVRIYHPPTKQTSNTRTFNPCQVNNGGCAHFCMLSHLETTPSSMANTNGGFRCKCKIGFSLNRDLRTCERIYESLYVSQMNMIRGVPMDVTMVESESREPILMPRLSATRAIEVDCGNNRTFFHDPIRKAIYLQ